MTPSSKGFRDLIRLTIVAVVLVTGIVLFWRSGSKSLLQQARDAQQAENRDEAQEFYHEYLRVHPEDASVRLEYAQFLSEFDRRRALAELSRIPENTSDWFEAQKLKAQLYDELGQLSEAQQLIEQLVERGQADGELHFHLARIYDRLGKNLSALTQVDLALQENPELSDAYLLKALLLAGFNRFPEMISPLRESLRRHPDDRLAQLNLALAYRQSGKLQLAGQTLEAMSEDKRNWPEFWLEQALLAKDQGEMELAEQSLNRALKLNPELLEARLLHCELLMVQGKYELAREELKPLYQQERTNRKFLSMYARAAAFSGDQDLAEQLTRELSHLLEAP
ncbi:MAG: tetratricopeptide repeat protein [Planctomycetaceae bacterium]|nr:tetratricopeptide repeat protein [Planctomycetaceae bacterium]